MYSINDYHNIIIDICMPLAIDEIVWKREEALGTIAAVQMLDLPAGQSELIETFVEMTKSESNPLKVAALRVQLQVTLTKVCVRCLCLVSSSV